jgi:hypothetical protein
VQVEQSADLMSLVGKGAKPEAILHAHQLQALILMPNNFLQVLLKIYT